MDRDIMEAVPEIGFLSLLLEVEAHKVLSKVQANAGAANGIYQKGGKQWWVDSVQDA